MEASLGQTFSEHTYFKIAQAQRPGRQFLVGYVSEQE